MARRLIDRSRTRELKRQHLLLDRLTAQFRGPVKSVIAGGMADMVNTWEHTREVMIPQGFRGKVEAVYRQMAHAAITAFGQRVVQQGKHAGLILETKDFASTMQDLALTYIQQEGIRRRITDVTETTRQQVISAIDQGYRDGLGTQGVAGYVMDMVDGISAYRANVIARTEIHGAANYGSNEAAAETGLPLKREWIAAHDMRTRTLTPVRGKPDEFGHRQMDGQIVGQDQPFLAPMRSGGVEAIMYPGDPHASPGNVINCRCTLGFIVDDGIDDIPATPPPAALTPAAPAAPVAPASVTVTPMPSMPTPAQPASPGAAPDSPPRAPAPASIPKPEPAAPAAPPAPASIPKPPPMPIKPPAALADVLGTIVTNLTVGELTTDEFFAAIAAAKPEDRQKLADYLTQFLSGFALGLVQGMIADYIAQLNAQDA